MNIETTIRTLKWLPPRQSVLIEANHGTGKSSVVAQTAAQLSIELKKPFGFVDIRLGQYEIGDLIGLPRAREKYDIVSKVFDKGILVESKIEAEHVTVHDLPLWFPRDSDSQGFLFFDELNRGSRDTQQWAMQIVLDYKSNFVELPMGWRVIAACNDDQDVYNVMGLDAALYDRFMVIKFQPTVKEWLDYAEKHGVHPAIVKYVSKVGSELDPPEKMEPGKKYPSRRSWEKFSITLQHMDKRGDDPLKDLEYLIHLGSGFVGSTSAVGFKEFVQKDYKIFTPEEILNKFPKLKSEFEKMVATDIAFYNKELVSYIKKNGIKLAKKQSDNLFDYIKVIPRETASGFWRAFLNECKEESTRFYTSSKVITDYIFGLLDKSTSMK